MSNMGRFQANDLLDWQLFSLLWKKGRRRILDRTLDESYCNDFWSR